jgi:predicted amidohydrolase
MAFTVAAAQYPVDRFRAFADYEIKITRWVREAAERGAKLVVFPEYGAMELTSIAGPQAAGDLQRALVAIQDFLPAVHDLHRNLAQQQEVHICAASAPVRQNDGSYRNTARLYAPSGRFGAQEKRVMTRFEREDWRVGAGEGLAVFATALGRIGIALCYDAEFPLLVRALVEAGAEIVLVPSCTDGLSGYHRVRVACAARALENQCIVVQAPTVGEAPWSPAIDVNVGAANVFGPPDRHFPDDGVIATGALCKPGFVYAKIDLGLVQMVRRDGQVLNHRHWREQPGAGVLPEVTVVELV